MKKMQINIKDQENFQKAIEKSKEILEKGGIICFPTETVYGIGALINQKEAIEKIYHLKRRERTKALAGYFSNIEKVKKYVKDFPKIFNTLWDEYLPGPLTMILDASDEVPEYLNPCFDSLAIRVADNKFLLALLDILDAPLVGTSANISGEESMKDSSEPNEILDNIDLFIDEGKVKLGIESTVILIKDENFEVLREGYLSKQDILNTLNNK